jgi:hypothetical protein
MTVGASSATAPAPVDETAPDSRVSSSRAALIVFGLAVAGALPLYLWRGRHQWFYLDEWDFLAGRSATSVHDLLTPHNEHWSTVPILVYRAMWRVFGLSTYKPYQLMTIGLHLTAACLVRVVMRRAGVRPWTATFAAGLFVFLGTGHENILWAFQLGFVASLVCGLGHLLLADHDGPFTRQDAAGVVIGAIGLMCSGVGVTMVAVVGIAVFLRRGWRVAALHVVPLAALFLTWWIGIGRDAYARPSGSLHDRIRVVMVGLVNVFEQLGQHPVAGIALAVTLAAGLVYAAVSPSPSLPPFRTRASAPIGLLCGGVIFVVISSIGRVGYADVALRLHVIDSLDDISRAGRYVHLLAAFLLPALAVAADALMQRSKLLVPAFALLFVVGVWGNTNAIEQTGTERFRFGPKDEILAVAQAPFADQIPAGTRILGIGGPEVTMGWVRTGVKSGRIPTPSYSDKELATVGLSTALEPRAPERPPTGCTPLTGTVPLQLARGRSFDVRNGPVSVVLVYDGVASNPIMYNANPRSHFVARAGPLDLRVSPVPRAGAGATPTELCGSTP